MFFSSFSCTQSRGVRRRNSRTRAYTHAGITGGRKEGEWIVGDLLFSAAARRAETRRSLLSSGMLANHPPLGRCTGITVNCNGGWRPVAAAEICGFGARTNVFFTAHSEKARTAKYIRSYWHARCGESAGPAAGDERVSS